MPDSLEALADHALIGPDVSARYLPGVAIVGWRATPDDDEHYIYAVAL